MKIHVSHYRVPNLGWLPESGKPHYTLLYQYSRNLGQLEGEFYNVQPSPCGGKTVVVIEKSGKEYVGEATCSFSDSFCYRIGQEIATGRAKAEMEESV